MLTSQKQRRDWSAILGQAAAIVAAYETSVTLRQLFYRLVAAEVLPMVEQLEAWFGQRGIPILALGGYPSQSFVDCIRDDVDHQDRPAVLIYAGDFDPSGEDIDRDFLVRTACFDKVVRVALTDDQVDEYELPEQMGKASDSRAARFIARHGRLVQVELDALPPDTLHELYEDAVAEYWDESAFEAVLDREQDDAEVLGEAS